jgi:hypothetical protein
MKISLAFTTTPHFIIVLFEFMQSLKVNQNSTHINITSNFIWIQGLIKDLHYMVACSGD